MYKDILKEKRIELKEEGYVKAEEEKYNKLIESMKEAVIRATGKRISGKEEEEKKKRKGERENKERGKRNPVEWWDAECEEAIKNRKEALKRVKKVPSLKNWIEYKRNRAMARKIIKNKKKENFRKFAGSLNKSISINYIWNKIKVLKNRDNKRTTGREGEEEEKREMIREEIEKLAPPWVEEIGRAHV